MTAHPVLSDLDQQVNLNSTAFGDKSSPHLNSQPIDDKSGTYRNYFKKGTLTLSTTSSGFYMSAVYVF